MLRGCFRPSLLYDFSRSTSQASSFLACLACLARQVLASTHSSVATVRHGHAGAVHDVMDRVGGNPLRHSISSFLIGTILPLYGDMVSQMTRYISSIILHLHFLDIWTQSRSNPSIADFQPQSNHQPHRTIQASPGNTNYTVERRKCISRFSSPTANCC